MSAMAINVATGSDSQSAVLMEARDLVKTYRSPGGFLSASHRPAIRAVDRLNLTILDGEVFGLIGESGCGKTTTAKLLMGLERPTGGSVMFDGRDTQGASPAEWFAFRRRAQMIFQDPYESMNPGLSILEILTEPLVIHGLARDHGEAYRAAGRALESIDLTPPDNYLGRFPHELSGGQRQRVAIARALILSPTFVAADEPTSMLDVSVRAGILNLMDSLKERMGLTYLFITHDLSVAKYLCDRIGVMYNGKLVEVGPADEVIRSSAHPYTFALTTVVSDLEGFWRLRESIIREGDRADAPTQGCRFAPRCPRVRSLCAEGEPELVKVATGHLVACHV
jgi:peptide/nickel transport system ATP-binding protein